jgi:hypothetical protein
VCRLLPSDAGCGVRLLLEEQARGKVPRPNTGTFRGRQRDYRHRLVGAVVASAATTPTLAVVIRWGLHESMEGQIAVGW